MISRHLLPSALSRAVDIVLFIASGLVALYQYQIIESTALDFQRYFSLILIGTLVFILLNNRLYRSWRSEGFFKLIQSIAAVLIKTWILIVFWLVLSKTNELYSRAWILFWALNAFTTLLMMRYLSHLLMGWLRERGVNLKNVVIIGSSATALELKKRVKRSPWSGFNVVKYVVAPDKEQLTQIGEEPYDEIWLALAMNDHGQIEFMMEGLKNSTANVRLVPDWFSYRLINHGISEVLGVEMLDLYGTPMKGMNLFIKSAEDFILSLLFIVAFSPLYLFLALVVRLSSPGPIFYRQKRVGWNGVHFDILKFRTMPVDIEADGVIWGSSDLKANNQFCRWMRRTSLDELPQFFNVLRGEMSIVGPRPERPEFVEKFKDEIPGYMKKHLVKAGITGWAQIHGWRGDTDLEARIEHDLFYIDNWSLMLDLKIIFYTPWRGLIHRNAY